MRKIGLVSLVMFSAAASQMLANLILGRTLSKEDYGVFSLIRKLIMFGNFFVLLSLDAGLIRQVPPKVLVQANWHRYLRRGMVVVILMTVLPVAVTWLIYNIQLEYLIILFLIICISGFLLLSNAILRIYQQFMRAQLLVSGFRLIFLLIMILLWIRSAVTLDSSLVLLLVAYGLILFIAFIFLKPLPAGTNPIPFRNTLHNSSEYYLLTLATITFVVIDTFFVAKMAGFRQAGIYSAVSLLPVTVFNLAGSSVGQVLMPLLAAGRSIPWRKIVLIWVGMAVPLTLFFLMLTNPLNHFFFAGKYDGYPTLVCIFVLIGLFQLTGIYIYAILGGIGTRRYLRYYLISSTVIQLVHLLAMFLVIRWDHGIQGVAAVTAIFWLLRDLIGIGFIVLQNSTKRHQALEFKETGLEL